MKIETYIRCTGAQGTPVDASNLPAAVNPPILCLGMSADLKLHFFDGEASEQMDAEAFEDIGSWRLSVDTDYTQATEPILRWTTGISVDEDGTVLVAIPNVSSDKLVAALGVKQSGEYIAELAGYTAGAAVPSFVVQFALNIYNRIDLEGGSESIPVSSGYYTNSQVDALLASAYEFQFSADGESWHDTQVGTDVWFRIKNGSVSGAQWSDPIAIPAGRDGVDGVDGRDGVSPVISVGTVSTGSAGTSASVTSRVSSGGTMYLDFIIPRGSDGSGTVGSGNLIFTSGGTQVATYNPQTNSDVTVPLPSDGSGTVGSGNLIFTSGGTQVATFNANQSSDTTVALPAGGGSGSGTELQYSSGIVTYPNVPYVDFDAHWIAPNIKNIGSMTVSASCAEIAYHFYQNRDLNTLGYICNGVTYYVYKVPLIDAVCVYAPLPEATANGVYYAGSNGYTHQIDGRDYRIINDSGDWTIYEVTPSDVEGEYVWVPIAMNAGSDGPGVCGSNHIAKYGYEGGEIYYVADFRLDVDMYLPSKFSELDAGIRSRFQDLTSVTWSSFFSSLQLPEYFEAYRHPYESWMHVCNKVEHVTSASLVAEFGKAYLWSPSGTGALSVKTVTDSSGLWTMTYPDFIPKGYTGRIFIVIQLGESDTVTLSGLTMFGTLKQNTYNICEILYPYGHQLGGFSAALVVYNSIGDTGNIDAITLNGSALAITSRAVDIPALTAITLNGSASGVTITSGVADLTVTGGGGEVNVIDAIAYDSSSATVTSKVAQLSGIIPIPTVGSADLIFTSGGTQVATFNANATTNVTLALPEGGGSSAQAITVIPAATTAYTLTEGHFTHIPTSATTYTLPAVSDNTHEHEIVLDVAFDNVQTIVFHDNSGNTVTPQDEITIAAADVWRFLCQWNTLLSCWCIMPIQMTDNTTYPPSIAISPSSYTISGTAGTALTSLDLSSNVTVTHPTAGVSPTFSSLDLPAGITITSAGIISGTPTSQGVTSSTIGIAYTGATSITCSAVFDIEAEPAPTPTYYYTVSGATATSGANGDYYVHSGTHGSTDAIYTNGTYYMFYQPDCWVINDSPEWDPEGLGPLWGAALRSAEGDFATVPTGTWTNGNDMPTDEATVSAYSA